MKKLIILALALTLSEAAIADMMMSEATGGTSHNPFQATGFTFSGFYRIVVEAKPDALKYQLDKEITPKLRNAIDALIIAKPELKDLSTENLVDIIIGEASRLENK